MHNYLYVRQLFGYVLLFCELKLSILMSLVWNTQLYFNIAMVFIVHREIDKAYSIFTGCQGVFFLYACG